MSFDYDELADVVSDVLDEFGANVQLHRHTATGDYDKATSTATETTTSTTRKGALFDFGAGVTVGPGGLVEVGDKRLFLEAGVEPTVADTITAPDGHTYSIKPGIKTLAPAGTVMLYELHLKR